MPETSPTVSIAEITAMRQKPMIAAAVNSMPKGTGSAARRPPRARPGEADHAERQART
jgi:hypothetical protein